MRVELFPPDSDTEPRHWVRHDQAFDTRARWSVAAIVTRSARESAFIFRIMLPRCAFTVISLMPSSAPTCLFNRPETTNAITSLYEIVRVICEEPPTRPSTAVSLPDGTNGEPDTVTPEMVSRARDASPAELRRQLSGDLDNILLKSLSKVPLVASRSPIRSQSMHPALHPAGRRFPNNSRRPSIWS